MKPHLEIRQFENSDAEALSTVITRCLREVNSADYPAKLIETMVTHFSPDQIKELATKREMYVALDLKRAIGTVSRDGNKVYTMFVSPDYAGQGIGRQLMDRIERLAAAEGYDFMETGASITAHDFYRKRGYVDIRESETDFGLNYILRKPLQV